MGRKPRYSKKEKVNIIERYHKGEDGLKHNRKPCNPFAKYINKKELTEIEKLEYEIAKKDHKLLKKEIEILKLKKLPDLKQGTIKRKN